MFARCSCAAYAHPMSNRDDWGGEAWTREDTARLKQELREEATRLAETLRREWMAATAEQAGPRRGGSRHHGDRGAHFGRQPLSRERIVDSAMKIMEKEGLDKVTMRKVAWDLDTGPASLYAHVRSMAELHGHMLDRILAGMDLSQTDGDWRHRLAAVLDGYVALLMKYPEFARSAITAKPSGRNYLAVVERLLALMEEGGIAMTQAAWGVDLLLLWATAGAAEHAEGDHDDQGTEWEALRTAVSNASEFPHISALGLDLISGDGEARSAWSIQVLLNGIAATPRP